MGIPLPTSAIRNGTATLNKNARSELRVIFLTSSYPRTRDDSASIFLRYLAEQLRKLNITVHVLAPADTRVGTTDENGIIVHRFSYFPKKWRKLAYGSGILPNIKQNPWLWLEVPFFIVLMLYSTLRLVRRIRPHIIHAHWIIPQGIVATLIKIIYKVPVVVTAHGGDSFAFTKGPLSTLKRVVIRNCDAWTSNTRATARAIVQSATIPEPYIIPIGVDIERFQSGNRNKLRTTEMQSKSIVLFVGRLVEKKGVDDLLAAFALLPGDLQSQTLLWIVGGGEQKNKLSRQAEHLGITDKVRFFGYVPNSQLPDYYAAADLFVGPSVIAASGDTEGQGVVFLEAFAAKLCVLATNVGGIREVVEDGVTGVLVEPRSSLKLASKIKYLLENPDLRNTLAANAYLRAEQLYSWANVTQKFHQLYRTLAPSS